jgi:hypothetical protein
MCSKKKERDISTSKSVARRNVQYSSFFPLHADADVSFFFKKMQVQMLSFKEEMQIQMDVC